MSGPDRPVAARRSVALLALLRGRVRAAMSFFGRPHVLRRVHGVAAVLWLALGIGVVAVAVMTFLQRSIAFLVFVSIYANVMGHWSSWQAARVEVRQDDAS